MCTNGWDGVTAALQLVSHLEGDARNVALLVQAPQRVLSGVLLDVFTEHYSSPGRLADYRRQFERFSRMTFIGWSLIMIRTYCCPGGT